MQPAEKVAEVVSSSGMGYRSATCKNWSVYVTRICLGESYKEWPSRLVNPLKRWKSAGSSLLTGIPRPGRPMAGMSRRRPTTRPSRSGIRPRASARELLTGFTRFIRFDILDRLHTDIGAFDCKSNAPPMDLVARSHSVPQALWYSLNKSHTL